MNPLHYLRSCTLQTIACSSGLQLAAASGANVIATSSSDDKLEIAKKLGATHVINYKKTPDWEKEVLSIVRVPLSSHPCVRADHPRQTGGRGVDHIIEVGGPGTLNKSLESVRMAGWIHLIGFVAGTVSTPHGVTA